jgi:3-hydroxymyristoyl/3-hydroxydecanoyl-(acyl carrier protein) dehydratase
MDDVVKVAGKRVALGDIERRLREIPGVDDVAVGSVEVGGARGVEPMAIVVAPGMTPELLRSALSRHLDPVVIPRRLRIVADIPRDERGKLSRERLRALYDAAATATRELVVGDVSTEEVEGATVRRVRLTAPRDLTWFRGHFATYPLLPGVVQLELAAEHAHRAWDDLRQLRRVVKLKFKRPIRPGETVTLALRRKAAQTKVSFEFAADGGLASSGVLDFGPREQA